MVVKLLIAFLMPVLLYPLMSCQYAILQAEHYEINRYFKHELRRKIIVQIIGIFLIYCSFLFNNYLLYVTLGVSFMLNILLTNKKKLKYTKRIKRFLTVYYLLTSIIYVAIPFNLIQSIIFLNNLFLFLLITVHCVSSCIESVIMKYYIMESKKIIKNKKIIGITGSYGKTSSKNILYDMLENVCNVSKTPKSYNTKVGIVKSIRENVNEFDDLFICEYGVDRKGGMDKLLKIVKPNVSLITEIGQQHLLTFKNIENIKNEKLKIAKILNEEETVVINNDNKYLNEEINNINCKIITYGIKNSSDIMAKNIEVTRDGSSFDLYVKGDCIKRINIDLLGYHNVLNTLGAIGVLKALDINLNNIGYLVKKITPVEHRLQLKNINGIRVIDDSFNSNEVGFKMAVDVLALMEEEKIIITPGIIEQGGNNEKVNFELGQYMADKVNLAILVEKNFDCIKRGLISKGFDENKIIIKNNFLDAWGFVKNLQNNKIILIENDLPSIYLK